MNAVSYSLLMTLPPVATSFEALNAMLKGDRPREGQRPLQAAVRQDPCRQHFQSYLAVYAVPLSR